MDACQGLHSSCSFPSHNKIKHIPICVCVCNKTKYMQIKQQVTSSLVIHLSVVYMTYNQGE